MQLGSESTILCFDRRAELLWVLYFLVLGLQTYLFVALVKAGLPWILLVIYFTALLSRKAFYLYYSSDYKFTLSIMLVGYYPNVFATECLRNSRCLMGQ